MKEKEDTLIRLHTEDKNVNFDCVFNEGIPVLPNAQIAMHSLQMERLDKSLEITGANDTVQFRVTAGVTLQTSLPHGTFNKDTANRKLTEITDRMNFELRSNAAGGARNTKQTGTQIRAFVGGGKKINVLMKHAGAIQPDSTKEFLKNVALTAGANQTLKSTSTTTRATAVNAVYMAYTEPIGTGCSYATVRVKTLGDAGGVNSGFYMGITENIDKIKTGQFTLQDFECAFKVQNSTANIVKFNSNPASGAGPDANFVDSTIAPQGPLDGSANATRYGFQFQNHDGNVSFRMNEYSNVGGGTGTVRHIGEDELAVIRDSNAPFLQKSYYVVIGIFGINTDCVLDQMRMTPDPFVETPTVHGVRPVAPLEDGFDAVPYPQSRPTASVYSLTFASSVADYFGYVNSTSNLGGLTTSEGIFIADLLFENSVTSDNYIVQLLNIPVNSYDSIKEGRENILSIVPFSELHIDDVTGLVQYEPNERLFLSIKNEYPIDLRRIRARVVGLDFQPIDQDGIASLNIIIRNRVEVD